MENKELKKRIRVKKYYAKRKDEFRALSLIKRISLIILISIVALSAFSFLSYNYFYYQYEDVILTRIQSGFWQSRAGVYSAPRRVTVGQKISQKELIDLLQRASYVEGAKSDSFWNGTYETQGDTVSVRTNTLYKSSPSSADIEIRQNKIVKIQSDSDNINFYDIKPEMLTGRSDTKRSENHVLKYEQIPENLKNAIVFTEDRRFFEHSGIDPKAVLRALWQNVSENRIVQGGSTLTQQLVKNTFLSNERTFSRKFSEAFLALALEDNMSKEDILTLYCNEVYLGQHGITGIHGFGAASQAYFDKDIKDLTDAEAATLAAMIKSPNAFSLGRNRDKLRERRDLILGIMRQENAITGEAAEIAKKSELEFSKPKADENAIAPYFVDSVIKELPTKIQASEDFADDDLRVYTTIDTNLQEIAEKAIDKHAVKLEKIYSKKGLKPQATLVAMDPKTGHVLALVGGNDYAKTQFNRATQAKRQPGSVFKPFVYATAIERGYMPTKVYADKPVTFNFVNSDPYKPSNYGGNYAMKELTMKTALAKSSNVIAVEIALDAGLERVSEKAHEFGFENIQPYPSMALGTNEVTPLQMAAAYSVFANGGKKVDPVFINEIYSGDGGYVYKHTPVNEEIISEQTAYMITDMLQAVVERGTASGAKNAFGKNVAFAGKTGSSKDGWFVGYTPNLVCVVWVGIDENKDIESTGGEVALPLWIDFMKEVLQKRPEFGGSSFRMPSGLTTARIDPETGMLAGNMCPQTEDMIIPKSSVSNVSCLKHQNLPEIYMAENEIEIREPEISINESTEVVGESVELIEVERNEPQRSRINTTERQTEKRTLQTIPKVREKSDLRRELNSTRPVSRKNVEVKPYPTELKSQR